MAHFSNWVLGFCAVVMGIASLFVASHAGEGIGYYGGLAMFGFCVLFVFLLIRTGCDHAEKNH